MANLVAFSGFAGDPENVSVRATDVFLGTRFVLKQSNKFVTRPCNRFGLLLQYWIETELLQPASWGRPGLQHRSSSPRS